jgi:hypothetical protein
MRSASMLSPARLADVVKAKTRIGREPVPTKNLIAREKARKLVVSAIVPIFPLLPPVLLQMLAEFTMEASSSSSLVSGEDRGAFNTSPSILTSIIRNGTVPSQQRANGL